MPAKDAAVFNRVRPFCTRTTPSAPVPSYGYDIYKAKLGVQLARGPHKK